MNQISKHLAAVCENATVALFVMDEQQCCVYMNPAAETLTGYGLSEVQGRPLHYFIHHSHPDGSHYPLEDCPIDRAAPNKMQERGEEVFVHRDGSFYPVTFTASPIMEHGMTVGTVIEVVDARPFSRQEREREALRQIGLVVLQELDHEKIVQAVTDVATELTGAQFGAFFYNVRDEKGESYTLYAISGVSPDKFSSYPLPKATALFGPTFRGEATIRIDDVRADPRFGASGPHHGMPVGHLPVCSYLAVPVTLGTGEVIGGLFFGHERAAVFLESHERIVETIAAQAAIGLNKASLFQEAHFARQKAERDAVEKQRLYDQAARANEAKDQFLAVVSHELRTPLTSILGWAQMLASGKLSADMVERAITSINRNARSQAQIVEDLLDISRIVSGKLRLSVQQFSPQGAAEAAVESLRPAAFAKSIALSVTADPSASPILGDPERLQQIIWNLVSNAIKFTPKGGRVHVAVQKSQAGVSLTVTDNGAGIAVEHINKIFDNFTQVDATSTRSHGGLGLGLAIVKKLVELHGGSVMADSKGLGFGASFVVTLPLAAASAKPSETAVPQLSDRPPPEVRGKFELDGASVLLVEDDDDARAMLVAILSSAGAVVEAAANARDALCLWDGLEVDMIVSDIGMPEMDGFAFISEVRKREALRGAPVTPAVALTAYARVQDRLRALTSGFQMHVAKPVDPVELLTILSSLRGWRIDR